jgi:acyl-CoA dehydrogenase
MSGHLERRLRRLKKLYAEELGMSGSMRESSYIEVRLQELDLSVLTYSNFELQAVLEQTDPIIRAAQSSILKILHVDLQHRIDDLAVDILGPMARVFSDQRPLRAAGESIAGRTYLEPFLPTILAHRGLSIEGGTHEVQRNLIARELLR